MFRLFRYFKPFIWQIILILSFMFAHAIAELYLPNLMADVVNNGMLKGDTEYIWKHGGYMLIVALVSSICAVFGSLFSAAVATGFGRDIREYVFKKVENFSLHEFDKINTSSLINRTTNDITQVQAAVIMMFRIMIFSPLMCIGAIIMALHTDRELTVVLMIAVPLLIATIVIIASAVVPLFRAIQKKLDNLNLILRENLTGIRVIRAFNRIDKERKRFADSNRDLTDLSIKVNKIMAAMQPMMILFMSITPIAIVWFGGLRIDSGEMQIGDMMAFIQYSMHVMFSIIMVSIIFVMIPRAQVSAVRINEVLDMEPEINDTESPEKTDGRRGYLEFRDVTFSYHGAEQPAISNISFSAKPGETVAIIGGTGSGKSTLVSLIPRFYDVDSGSILIDGTDVRKMAQKELRAKIGLVPQTAVLFSGTVADNIRFGKDDATEEEIRHAIEVAQASRFISNMENGYDSEIAQGGTNISGGQKQRLSIARALVRKPEIYIFDDSFSALDFKTDARLRAALKKETADSTVLIVAQRVSTVMDADRIIVLDDGRIVGMGTHKELLKSCEVYREIVSSQLSEEEIA